MLLKFVLIVCLYDALSWVNRFVCMSVITAIANRTPQYKCYKNTSQTTAVNKIDPLNSTEIYDTQ